MNGEAPPSWREDLHEAVPWIDPAEPMWLGNLNASYPWRVVVSDIRLPDGRRVILKSHTDADRLEREHAPALYLADSTAPHIAPHCLGVSRDRKTLAFERLLGPTLAEALDGTTAWTVWRETVRLVAALHDWAAGLTARWLELCPQDRTASRLPAYALPFDALVAPFHRAGKPGADLTAASAPSRPPFPIPAAGWASPMGTCRRVTSSGRMPGPGSSIGNGRAYATSSMTWPVSSRSRSIMAAACRLPPSRWPSPSMRGRGGWVRTSCAGSWLRCWPTNGSSGWQKE